MDWVLNHVLEEGFEEVFLCGGLAGRLDHSIGNLQLMIAYAQRGLRVWGFTESEVVVPLVAPGLLSRLAFDPVPEGTLSFMAHSSEVRGVTERGLEYEVSDGTFTALSPWGVSNEFVGKPASVSIDEGSAWVFFPYVALPQAHWGRAAGSFRKPTGAPCG
jgi:thiamine pyrophosphokinase